MTEQVVTIADVAGWLRGLAPLELAEEWDNVGLLVGDASRPVRRVMTCLTLTADVAREAAREGAQLVVTHHPLLFKPARRLTADNSEGRTLLALIEARIAVYSPHTAFDSAAGGINVQLAESLGLADVRPLRPPAAGEAPMSGGGRCGRLPQGLSLAAFLDLVRRKLGTGPLQYVGDPARAMRVVGVACGSAAEFIPDAARAGCDVLLTGEARFHALLEARDLGLALVLPGHYATERPGVEALAREIAAQLPQLEAWASRDERDPLAWSIA
jgi:dinuclear metal center YbgI/SA1388 family protein